MTSFALITGAIFYFNFVLHQCEVFADKPGLLRLQGPLSGNGTGRVEIFYNGTWGTICDDEWDMRDARVACRQLGYPYAVKILEDDQVSPGSGPIWLDEVNCTGKEENISRCNHLGWGDNNCGHNEDAGVECSNKASAPVSLRLRGTLSANGTGRVEVLYNGQWGTICDNGWDMRDARVVCRQLGYPDAVRALKGRQVPSGSRRVWLEYVDCTGEEENIARCIHQGWGKHNCDHSKDVGVECDTGGLRLQGPLSTSGTGRVEVFYNQTWGTICDVEWDFRDARVVCRQLGFFDAVRALQGSQVPHGSGPIWLNEVDCIGSERNLRSCSHSGWSVSGCFHHEDAGVECSTTDNHVLLRLQGPLSADGAGRVEVFYNKTWGAICDYGWDFKDARVACRQLGYQDAVRPLKRNEVPSGSGKIWLINVACTGEEQNISSCTHRGWGVHPCSHLEDAGVKCSTTVRNPASRLRLQGPLSANGTGRVEVLYNGTWGTICNNGWDMRDARVICRQLGYRDAVRYLQMGQVSPGSGRIWLDGVDCSGKEENISSCLHRGWGIHNCNHLKDAGVECKTTVPPETPVSLRLQGPSNASGAGRIEVFYNGQWGTICSNKWDIRDARVVCRQLGYLDAVRALSSHQTPPGSGRIWLDYINCTGKEIEITSCSHKGWGNHHCNHSTDAGVECTNTSNPALIRLQGPMSANGIGRVEVYHYGQWGTICENGWDVRDARVVCRQLGYKYVAKILPSHQVSSGSGPIWLADVSCTGQEQNITSCSHNGWRNHNCSHSQVVGVECTNTGPCLSVEDGTREAYGIFKWPETPVGNISELPCPYNGESTASRECLYSNRSDSGSIWGGIMASSCKFKNKRSKDLFHLSQEVVDFENVVNVTQEVRNLSHVNPEKTLQPGDINNIATILQNIVAVKGKSSEVSDDFLTTVDNVLDNKVENVFKSQQEHNSSSRIVQALNDFAETLVLDQEGKFEKVKRNYALNLIALEPQKFNGITFSGITRKTKETFSENINTSIKFDACLECTSSTSLVLPQKIFDESAATNSSRNQTIVFVFYKETKFFKVTFVDAATHLNSFVISGSIKRTPIANLKEPVKIAFKSVFPGDTNSTLCSYWDFSLQDWSQDGCWFERALKDGRVLCNCNHFTNFAMLMAPVQAYTPHEQILSIISTIGCVVSLVGLIFTIITILLLRELRTKVPSQILLNFCIALALMLIAFLASPEMTEISQVARCRAAAIALHYFLLAAFLWMAVEGLNMYLAFVKVFPYSSPTKFMVSCCLFAWGAPAVIVGITMAVAMDEYGGKIYCRLQGLPFIVAFLTPAVVIFVGNIVAFCLIMYSLLTSGKRITSDRKTSGFQHVRQGIAIMVLLGLTWLFGILAIDDATLPFQYLFCIFNSLQGTFVFIFFIILRASTRKKLLKFFRKRSTAKGRRVQMNLLSSEKSQQNNLDDATTGTDL